MRRRERSREMAIRFPDSLMKEIERICDEKGYSKAALIRSAVEFYLRDLELRERYGPGFVGTSDQRRDDLLRDERFLDELAKRLRDKEKHREAEFGR